MMQIEAVISPDGKAATEAADRILERFAPVEAHHLIPILQAVQDEFGYLPEPVLDHVSACTGIPTSRMYGVITFYSLFHTQPRGRHEVRACRGTACHVRGAANVIKAASDYLGIDDGETRDDLRFSFETVACLGACALSPVVVVDSTYTGKVTPERVEELLRSIEAEESAG